MVVDSRNSTSATAFLKKGFLQKVKQGFGQEDFFNTKDPISYTIAKTLT